MRIVAVADTHAPRFWKRPPTGLVPALRDTELILHAGDVCVPTVLDELAAYAPVKVVLGNNDGPDIAAWGAPEHLELNLDGFRIALLHIAGPRQGRANRMRKRFPDADLVVFGHSHQPLDDPTGAVHLFNPGSPTDKRREPVATFGELDVADGRLIRHVIRPLG